MENNISDFSVDRFKLLSKSEIVQDIQGQENNVETARIYIYTCIYLIRFNRWQHVSGLHRLYRPHIVRHRYISTIYAYFSSLSTRT